MKGLKLVTGDDVALASPYGEIHVTVEEDSSMRPGVVSTTHGWGGSGGDLLSGDKNVSSDKSIGASVNDLIPLADRLEEINGMPWFSALPVSVRKRDSI